MAHFSETASVHWVVSVRDNPVLMRTTGCPQNLWLLEEVGFCFESVGVGGRFAPGITGNDTRGGKAPSPKHLLPSFDTLI